MPERLAYSIADIIQLAGLSRASIYREIRAGRLRVKKIGTRTLVLPADLDAWLVNLRAA